MARAPRGSFANPPAHDALAWHAAIVPGTVAASLAAAGLWSLEKPDALEDSDYWYRARLEGHGPRVLRFEGLATLAEVWIDGALILRGENMFLRHDAAFELKGAAELAICFRALAPLLEKPMKRARWRSRLAQPANLRGVRTSLIGHMPSWCPPAPIIGPWRAVELFTPGARDICTRGLRASLAGSTGIVELALEFSADAPADARLHCAGARATCATQGARLTARLEIPDVELWWPHTHGEPRLHDLTLYVGGEVVDLGRVGFRSIEVDRGADGKGFGLRVNGTDVFCRGSVWTSADIVTAPGTREAYAPLLNLMREAGMNMARVGGTFAYETPAFFDLCDELGILVWQDLMFANVDHPFDDPDFRASAEAEARRFLDDAQSAPSLAVVCGGSEVFQQAAMTGLPPQRLAGNWFETALPALVEAARPDVVFVPNTPTGGALPFQPNEGISHYYGVSAYMRPLDDARRSNVRFAAECLGFANVPETGVPALEPGAPRLVQPCWNERFPYDAGAIWFFEDVRNHYIEQIYGVRAVDALAESPARYLALSRAVNAELMEAVFGEFRRVGSPTRGALTWFLKDVFPGAGWGLIDHAGTPKSVYYALKRAMRPVQILLVDEGLNGLHVHVLNETALARDLKISLQCLAQGATPVMRGELALRLGPRECRAVPATEVWGGFFDTNHAYRFGPPTHDVVIAGLSDALSGAALGQAFHFPLGRGAARHELGLVAEIRPVNGDLELEVSCARFAQSARIEAPGWRAQDNYFHLAPGTPRTILLRPCDELRAGSRATMHELRANPRMILSALNARDGAAS